MNIELLTLENTSIEEQLDLEQKLLREDDRSFIIIGTNLPPAIVMGSSQKADTVIHLDKAKEQNIPIIRRFSAGGCVILDTNSIIVTFILNKKDLNIDLFPSSIMNWTADFYKKALDIPNLDLTANDYTIGDRKIGGNAQYIKKDRFLHHTSFLWDYNKDHMDILMHPPKEPPYRAGRHHHDFLTTLKPHMTKEAFIKNIHAHPFIKK